MTASACKYDAFKIQEGEVQPGLPPRRPLMSTRDPQAIRLLLVEDHGIVRAGLWMLIENWPDLRVVGAAATRTEALVLAAGTRPDIILLDIYLGGESSLSFLPEVLAQAITKVHAGEVWLDSALIANVLTAARAPSPTAASDPVADRIATAGRALDPVGARGRATTG